MPCHSGNTSLFTVEICDWRSLRSGAADKPAILTNGDWICPASCNTTNKGPVAHGPRQDSIAAPYDTHEVGRIYHAAETDVAQVGEADAAHTCSTVFVNVALHLTLGFLLFPESAHYEHTRESLSQKPAQPAICLLNILMEASELLAEYIGEDNEDDAARYHDKRQSRHQVEQKRDRPSPTTPPSRQRRE